MGGAFGGRGPAYGWIAFLQCDFTLSGVSLPSRVVRSTMETARRRPCSFAEVLMERLVNEAARASVMTRSVVGELRGLYVGNLVVVMVVYCMR